MLQNTQAKNQHVTKKTMFSKSTLQTCTQNCVTRRTYMTPSFVPTRLHRFPALLAGDGEERPLGVEPRIGLALRGFNQPLLSLGSGELSKQGRVKNSGKRERRYLFFNFLMALSFRKRKFGNLKI